MGLKKGCKGGRCRECRMRRSYDTRLEEKKLELTLLLI